MMLSEIRPSGRLLDVTKINQIIETDCWGVNAEQALTSLRLLREAVKTNLSHCAVGPRGLQVQNREVLVRPRPAGSERRSFWGHRTWLPLLPCVDPLSPAAHSPAGEDRVKPAQDSLRAAGRGQQLVLWRV